MKTSDKRFSFVFVSFCPLLLTFVHSNQVSLELCSRQIFGGPYWNNSIADTLSTLC